MPLRRTAYSLRMLLRHRRELARIFRGVRQPRQALHLDPRQLRAEGITVLALDFDGVLAAHGEPVPYAEIQAWLGACVEVFGAERMFVLSNKPSLQRQMDFARLFPGVRWISGVRKKPYPDGLRRILELTGAAPRQIMLVDDRLLTGALAACIAGIRVGYVNRPYVNLAGRPAQELFFMSLRGAERTAVRLLTPLAERGPAPGRNGARRENVLRSLGRRLRKKPPRQD